MAMEITLTDGGIEMRIIYEFRRSIGDFEPTSCSETNRDVRSFGAFTKATLR